MDVLTCARLRRLLEDVRDKEKKKNLITMVRSYIYEKKIFMFKV